MSISILSPSDIDKMYIYPIKSCGEIEVNELNITQNGVLGDRHWMLVDDFGKFITQRTHPKLSLVKCEWKEYYKSIQVHFPDGNKINELLFDNTFNESTHSIPVSIWEDTRHAFHPYPYVSEIFSKFLQIKCFLVCLPRLEPRTTKLQLDSFSHSYQFADGYPLLFMSNFVPHQLSQRLGTPISPLRFRPNVLLKEYQVPIEDSLSEFSINDIHFYNIKPCERCIMVNINPNTSILDYNILKELRPFRLMQKKIIVGINVIYKLLPNEGSKIIK